MGALHEEDSGVFNDDGAYADQRDFGEFALHVCMDCKSTREL
jgi:hypothetical protein